jgi:hypothetical protein
MPADRMQGDPRRQLRWAIIEFEALCEIEPHDPDHVFDLERTGEKRMAHVAAGRVVQFGLLEVELRTRKPVKIADMVVMHVGEHDVLHRTGVDADQGECLDRAAKKPAFARRGDLRGKAGIDDDGMVRRDRGPHEIIHRHRAVMRVAADEMVGTPGVALSVADRIDLVFREMGVHSDLGTVSGLRKRGGDASLLLQPLITDARSPNHDRIVS